MPQISLKYKWLLATCLTVALKTLFDLRILLVQPLPPLLRQRVLVPITRVMTRQHVDGGVQSRETGLSRHIGESPVVTDEVDHLLLEILPEIFHAVRPLGQSRGDDHVVADFGGVGFVVVSEAPVGGEGVFFGLLGHGDLGEGSGGEDGAGGYGGGGLEEVAASGLLVLDFESDIRGRELNLCEKVEKSSCRVAEK